MSFRHILQILLIGLFCSFHCIPIGAQWQFLGSPETGFPRHYDYHSDKIYMMANAGLFVSSDEGNSWNAIPLPDSICNVNEVHESNGSLYLFNTTIDYDPFYYGAAYRSDDNGLTWKSIYPFPYNPFTWSMNHLVKGDTIVILDTDQPAVSVDKGETFTIHDLTPFQSHDIFFHKDRLMAVSYDQLYLSPDLGMTWDLVYTSPDSLIFMTIMSVDGILYKFDEFWSAPHLEGYFYRSDDDGVSWVKTHTFDNYFTAVPSISGDANHLFLQEDFGSNSIYHSTDQGVHWDLLPNDPVIHRFQYIKEIFFRLEYYESNGGVWLSHDIGQTFQQYNNGFVAADCRSIFAGNDKLWVSANGEIFKKESGAEWDELNNYENLVTDDGTHLMAYVNSVLKRSYDGGELWYTIPAPLFNEPSHDDFGQIFACGQLFFIHVGVSDIYVSSDYGVTWELFDELGNESITAVSYDDSGYVISGDSGSVLESTDGETWEDITYNIWAPGVASIQMVHRANGYTFANASNGNVKLSPGSTSWEDYIVEDPNPIVYVPEEEISALTNAGNVLIGAVFGHGVFVSLDNALTWQPFNFGLTDFQTRDVKVVDDVIYLAVNGGLWSRPLGDLQLQSYTGIVYNDKNENAVQDGDEEGLENIIVYKKVSLNSITTNADGTFNLYSLESFPDTILATPQSQYAYVTTPPVYVTGSTDQLSIGIHSIPGIYDGSIVLTNNIPFRPGFESSITITYKNEGTEPANFEIHLVLPAELDFLTASPDASLLLDTLSWIINDVSAGQSGNINVVVLTDVSVPIGTLLSLYSSVEVLEAADVNPLDNETQLITEVVGSYDPNDKSVFPAGYITPAMIADTQRLEYTIRFQNTGNFPATFVRIQDTLSSNLDLSTLQILSASHPFTWKLLPGNLLDIFFDNINLPDSTSDERGSHGFVKFAIDARPTLQLADQIENKAYIYFDFNVPVITNTVGSTVGFETGIHEPREVLYLTASPVPTKDNITVSFRNTDLTGRTLLTLFNTDGIAVKTFVTENSSNILLDLSELPSGLFFLKASNGNAFGTIRVIKI